MQANKLLLTTVLLIGASISGVAQSANSTSSPAAAQGSAQVAAAAQTPANSAQTANLPATGSALPLLSVIGFGVLVGGIASALKTR